MNLTRMLCLLGVCLCVAQARAAEIQGVTIFLPDNPWNRDVSNDPVHAKSDAYVGNILTGSNKFLHADFGSDTQYGIPFIVVPGTQAPVPLNIVEYADESDAGPFPVPLNAPVEGGDDHHVLVLDKDNAVLYEMYHAVQMGAGWQCGSSAKFDLKSNALRTDGFTSCDEAGLPILPGLVRFDEIAAGVITHALRFTVHADQQAYIHPATHKGRDVGPDLPPMGLKLRLKSNIDLSPFTGQSLIILTALKKYGMFVADIGGDWFISGASDARWNDADLNQLKTVPGSAFEAVESGPILGVDATGGSGGGTTPVPSTTGTLGAPQLKIGLDFNRGQDYVTLTCSLDGLTPVSGPLSGTASGALSVDVGGVAEKFTLSKGRGAASTGTAALRLSKKGPAVLQLKLKGSFAARFSDEGLTETNGNGTPTIHANVVFGGIAYSADIDLNYAVSKGKGLAK